MPIPNRSGVVKRYEAFECESRVPAATFSPMALNSRSLIFPMSSASSALMDLVLEAFDGEGGVMPTEAKTVAENSVDFPLDANVGCVVEIELRIGVLVVNGRRNDAVADHHRADHGLYVHRGAEHVSSCRLGRADIDVPRGIAEDSLNRPRLVEIVGRSRSAVSIDVLNVFRLETGVLEGALHGALGAFAVRCRCS